MNIILQAIIIALVSGGLSAVAINALKRFAPKVPKDPEPTSNLQIIRYSHYRMIQFVSFAAVMAWISILTFFIVIAAGALRIVDTLAIVIALLGLLLFASIYAVMAPFLKCDTCRRRMLVQWSNEIKPPFSENIYGMTSWSGTVLNVVIRNKFRCMYCGQKYEIKNQ